MELVDVKDLFSKNYIGNTVKLEGWIKNHRKQKELGFIDFSDGTCFQGVQVIYDNKLEKFNEISKLRVGSAIILVGEIINSIGKGQEFEIKLLDFKLEGDCPENYPIQPKRHTREFLREVAYLRPRTNLFNAVFRVRSIAAMAIHSYFQERGYVYVHTPIITASDAEGAGEMFKVTALNMEKLPLNEERKIDYKKDFFEKAASLTVSGQLQAEAFALSYKRVYTFGPTFRAENSNTKTHASEFWMIEPEIAFCDLNKLMDIQEDFLNYIIKYILDKAPIEMELFNKFVEPGITEKLKKILDKKIVRITHKEAIDILKNSNQEFKINPVDDEDLAKEHERYLTDEYFKSPVFVTNWPKDIKAFYMRLNKDETVAAVDLLVPGAGELMGGSQREERLDKLTERMDEMKISKDDLYWYINLRKFGGCKHAGFGMGFERFLIYITGVENIRDVIPFPRTPGNCEF